MSKIGTADYIDKTTTNANEMPELDEKVVDAYKKLGIVLKTYRSGKLPKAFKVIPMVSNWEELLFLTQP
jgi:essential nuclear protein 1